MSDKVQEFRIWQTKLYNLQREAPKPHVIPCNRVLQSRPPQYGIEYHGPISRQETEKLLEGAVDGAYLIRDSQRAEDAYTLVIWFDKTAKNFMLFYDPVLKQHYVGENRFDTVELLVADGLIHFYVETRGADVLQKIANANAYETTPFYKMRYHTFHANALNDALNQIIVEPPPSAGTVKERTRHNENSQHRLERRVSPPVKPHASATRNTAKPIPLRRQSIDAAQLARQTISSSIAMSTDRTPLSSKMSDQNSENWRYREWPPNTDRGESKKCSRTSEIDLTPIPPPRGMSACVSMSRQPPLSPVSVSHSTFNNVELGETQISSVRESPQSIPSQFLPPVQPNVNSTQNNVPEKLSHISENTDSKLPAVPTSFNSRMAVPFSTLTSSTGSHEFDSSGSFTNNTATTGSSSHPSPTDTSNSGSIPDGVLPTADRSNEPSRSQSVTSSITDSVSWRNETKSVDETARINAMLNLQERYNLPAACFADQMQSIEDSKPHNFKLHTFRGPHWCDYCTHFIWGLVAQGFKCTDCGFQAHKRCSDRVPCDCLPDIKQLKRVFGVDLTSLTRAERKNVPTILVRCIEEIERRGAMTNEGLYRIPGNQDRVDQVRAAFDKDSESADISVGRVADVNVITSLIKSFLRQLPVPLITYEAYPDFIDVIRNEQMTDDERLKTIRNLLVRLPLAHYESLRFFMQHIQRVAHCQDVNMMSAKNLAIVLSPSLMTSSYSDPISCMVGTRSEHALVERMIKDFNFLFPVTETPVRRVPTLDSAMHVSGPDQNKRNSQIPQVPVSPNPPSSQFGYVKRKLLRNRRSVDTPLLAAATANNPATYQINDDASSPTPATPIATTVQFSMNTAL